MLRQKNRFSRLHLENLEDRMVPTVIGTTDWTAVSASAAATYPNRPVVSIYERNSDGGFGAKVGSGVLIAPNVVVTAGHCVFNTVTNQWKGTLLVVPGQVGDSKPYGAASSVSLKTQTGWTDQDDNRYDIGVIYLDRNLGNFTGTFGLWNRGESYFDNNGSVNILQYPGPSGGTTLDGRQLVLATGNAREGTADFIRYRGTLDTEPGSSGSPVFVYSNNLPYLVGVHHEGTGGNHPNDNQAVRLNDFWTNTLVDWKDDRTTTDKADLMDKDKWFNTSTSTVSRTDVTAGGSLTINGRIWNGGTATANNFTVKFYASTNTTISTSDTYLGQVTFSSLTAFQTGLANRTVTLPSTMAAGYYRMGWIIDSGSSVNEYLENNNTGYVSSWVYVRAASFTAAHAVAQPATETVNLALVLPPAAPGSNAVERAAAKLTSAGTRPATSATEALVQVAGLPAVSRTNAPQARSSTTDELFSSLHRDELNAAFWLLN